MPLKTYTNTMHCPLPIHLKTPADFHTHRSSRNRALSTCNAIKNKSHIAETTRYIQKSRNMSLKTCILERETGICKLYRSSSNKKCKHQNSQKHKIRKKKKMETIAKKRRAKKKKPQGTAATYHSSRAPQTTRNSDPSSQTSHTYPKYSPTVAYH